MNKKIITFGDIEIKKHKFNHYKNAILIYHVDIKKCWYWTRFFPVKKKCKYFIGYKDDDYEIKPWYIMLRKNKRQREKLW